MRRYRLVPMVALTLALGACGANSAQTPRTLTEVVTVTGTSPAPTGSPDGSGGITVIGPSGSGAAGGSGTVSGTGSGTVSGTGTDTPSSPGGTGTDTSPSGSSAPTPTASAAPSTTAPSTTAAPTSKDQKVDPLHVACPSLLDNGDIKKALGASVSSASQRIVDVANTDVKMTGRIKCYYGVKTGSKAHPVAVALAQYASASAADVQMGITVKSETGLGADASTVDVSGKQAHVLLRDGGLLIMRYDTWTLSVAVEKKVASEAKLAAGLQSLAKMVLARVLKNG